MRVAIVDAVDYLIKPISYEEFSLKLKKAQCYIRLNQSAQLTLHNVTVPCKAERQLGISYKMGRKGTGIWE